MNRFYVPKENISGDIIRITDPDDARHFCKVLRIGKGEEVFISDGQGSGYIAAFDRESKGAALLVIRRREPVLERSRRPLSVTLACAVPKQAHFEDVIDKCTQLGVDRIVPLLTRRTLVSRDACLKKMSRWQRVRLAAAKQSGVLFLPELCVPLGFDEFLASTGAFDLKLVPNLSGETEPVERVVSSFNGRSIAVVIGPEGDFSPDEISAATHSGFKSVSLGESVLRVDTAAIALLGYLALRFPSR